MALLTVQNQFGAKVDMLNLLSIMLGGLFEQERI